MLNYDKEKIAQGKGHNFTFTLILMWEQYVCNYTGFVGFSGMLAVEKRGEQGQGVAARQCPFPLESASPDLLAMVPNIIHC